MPPAPTRAEPLDHTAIAKSVVTYMEPGQILATITLWHMTCFYTAIEQRMVFAFLKS